MEILFLVVLAVLVGVSSAFERKRRLKSPDRLPTRRKDSSVSEPWDCPSCGESIEPTSDTCPWCGWTYVPSENDTAPEDLGLEEEGLQAEEEGVTGLIPETDEAEDWEEAQAEGGSLSETRLPLAEAVQAILAEDIIGGKRDSLIKNLLGQSHSFELIVERVERTIALFSDPDFRNGRTVTGVIHGTSVEVSVLFPGVLNDEVDAFKPGPSSPVKGLVADWDRLRRRPVVRAKGV